MIKIRNELFIKFSNDMLTPVVRADIDVDTSDELPAVDGILGKKLLQGSTAMIIKEGILAVLAGDGSWVDAAGNVVKEA